MRTELRHWAEQFPLAAAQGNEAFANSAIARFVAGPLPAAIRSKLPSDAIRNVVKGSAGQGQWAHTPWVALMDRVVTTTVQDGYYVVYLLSRNGEQIYLSINQGCDRLKKLAGVRGAREELSRRAELMRARIANRPRQFLNTEISLGSDVWRSGLYQAGDVAHIAYDTRALPSEDDLKRDLHNAVSLYRRLVSSGGWEADDEISKQAEDEAGISNDLVQAKRYRQHKAIERQRSHSDAVKRAQGFRCKGCNKQMDELYGQVASDLIEAHHLVPLSSLDEDEEVTFNPKLDFAVLCPNCHAVIHRMDDPSDLEQLRRLIHRSSEVSSISESRG